MFNAFIFFYLKTHLLLFLFPGFRNPSRIFYFMYNFWQDAEIRTRVAATAARCATIYLGSASWYKIYCIQARAIQLALPIRIRPFFLTINHQK